MYATRNISQELSDVEKNKFLDINMVLNLLFINSLHNTMFSYQVHNLNHYVIDHVKKRIGCGICVQINIIAKSNIVRKMRRKVGS